MSEAPNPQDDIVPDDATFNPDLAQTFFKELNGRLGKHKVPERFEGTDDELRRILSLYATTSTDEFPISVTEDRVETKEMFIARNALLPLLTSTAPDTQALQAEHRSKAYQASTLYKQRMEEIWKKPVNNLISVDHIVFIRGVTEHIAKKLRDGKFHEGITREPMSLPPVQPEPASPAPLVPEAPRPKQQKYVLEGKLKPETENMSDTARVVRGLYEVAGLSPEEVAGLYFFLQRGEGSMRLHTATHDALHQLRRLYYTVVGRDEELLTPHERKRVRALIDFASPKSLHNQIAEAQRNGEPDVMHVERDLLTGLAKVTNAARVKSPAERAQNTIRRMQR